MAKWSKTRRDSKERQQVTQLQRTKMTELTRETIENMTFKELYGYLADVEMLCVRNGNPTRKYEGERGGFKFELIIFVYTDLDIGEELIFNKTGRSNEDGRMYLIGTLDVKIRVSDSEWGHTVSAFSDWNPEIKRWLYHNEDPATYVEIRANQMAHGQKTQ